MTSLQQLKNSLVGKVTVPLLSGAASGTVAENVIAAVRRTARHPLAEGAVLLAGSQYVAAVAGLVTSVVSARLLGPKDFGIAAVVMSYPMLLGSLVAVKSGAVTTRYIARFRADGRAELLAGICKLGYALDFLVSLGAALLVAATAWWVAPEFFHEPNRAWLMVAFAVSFPIWSLSGTSHAILMSFERFRWVALLQVLDQVIGSVLVIGLLLGGFGVAGAVLGAAFGNVLTATIAAKMASVVLRRERMSPWWRGSIERVRPVRKEIAELFGWNYLIVTGSGLMAQLPLMILAHFRGPEAAGFFRLATSIVTVGSYLETSMGRVVYPALSARWSVENSERVRGALKRWTINAGVPAGALLLLSLPFFPILIPLVFGSQYAPMVSGVQIMMTGAVLSALVFWLNAFYYASAHLNIWTLGYAVQTAFVITLAWLAARYGGFSGIALLTAVAKAGFTLGMLLVFYKLVADGRETIS
ncbi:MAG: lipopolysaccharide biosynthesis protein [Chloroflexota bacterium]